ncbi:ABC transporter substrate-binding protein [Deltaproteobacteria bacterium TL4]
MYNKITKKFHKQTNELYRIFIVNVLNQPTPEPEFDTESWTKAFEEETPDKIVINFSNTHLVHDETPRLIGEMLELLIWFDDQPIIVYPLHLDEQKNISGIFTNFKKVETLEEGIEIAQQVVEKKTTDALRKQQKKLLRWFWFILICLGSAVGGGFYYYFQLQEQAFRLALVGPLTGDSKANGRAMMQGAQLYLNKVNREGGINGKRVILKVFDDQNDKQLAQEKAVDVVEHSVAVAVIGHNFSDPSLSAGKIYRQRGIPAITPTSTHVDVTKDNSWYFRTISNDLQEGRFIANFTSKVLEFNKAIVIHEDLSYGRGLAEVFEEHFQSLGGKIQVSREFEVAHKDLAKNLDQVVSEILAIKEPGIIFLATHAKEAAMLIQRFRDKTQDIRFIVPSAMASKAFNDFFVGFPRERNYPGFYTNDIYITSPLIFDTAGEELRAFIVEYEALFNESPDWRSVYSYECALILIEAIKRTGITGEAANLVEDRKRIRDFLANLIQPADGIMGLTGLTYFDEKGDTLKPIALGVFKNNNIVSSYVQLQSTQVLSEIPNLEEAIKSKRIVFMDDIPLYRTNIVYSGIEVSKIDNIDFNNLSFSMDFHIWFRYRDDINVQDIEFSNALESIQLKDPVIEQLSRGFHYKLYHVKGNFKMDILATNRGLGEHILSLSWHHRRRTRNSLVFVGDVLGMGLMNDVSLATKLNSMQVLSPTTGWNIREAWYFQNMATKAILGNPNFINVQNGIVNYSQINVGIVIKRSGFTLRGLIPSNLANTIFGICVLLLVVTLFPNKMKKLDYALSLLPTAKVLRLLLAQKKPAIDAISRKIWLLNIVLISLMLFAAEIGLAKTLSKNMADFDSSRLIMIFDILWWIVPAFFINQFVEHFLWVPLEKRTALKVPSVVRNSTKFIIYLLAIFGVIAFVFNQQLTSVLASSGLLVMIIGLAIQANISNLFSGIVLNIERPFRVGDWIQIAGSKEGRVIEMTWRSIRVIDRSGCMMCIPNGLASGAVILNFNFPEDLYSALITIYVDPAEDPLYVKKILLDAILDSAEEPDILKVPRPVAVLAEINEWSAKYYLIFSSRNYARSNYLKNVAWGKVWHSFRRAGIKFATKRSDVYFHQPGKEPELMGTSPQNLLNEVALFNPFSDTQKQALGQQLKSRFIKAGEFLFKQGEMGNSMFIIQEGIIVFSVELENGESVEVSRLGAGSAFGEMSMLTGEVRTETAVADTNTKVLEIPQDLISGYLKNDLGVVNALCEVLSSPQGDRKARIAKQDLQNIKSFILKQIDNA